MGSLTGIAFAFMSENILNRYSLYLVFFQQLCSLRGKAATLFSVETTTGKRVGYKKYSYTLNNHKIKQEK